MANILFARELARRAAQSPVVSHAMHPAVVDSNFASHCQATMQAHMQAIEDSALMPAQAAETLVWLASPDGPGRLTGRYWHQCADLAPAAAALDDAAAARLWG